MSDRKMNEYNMYLKLVLKHSASGCHVWKVLRNNATQTTNLIP